jgi:hypothetical protein
MPKRLNPQENANCLQVLNFAERTFGKEGQTNADT